MLSHHPRKPPDPEWKLTIEEKEWLEDVHCANNMGNDKFTKPTIATLHFDNNIRPILFNKSDGIPPYLYKDEDDRTIDEQEVYHDVTHIKHNFDEHKYGQIITGDEIEAEELSDPFINLLKNTGHLNRQK